MTTNSTIIWVFDSHTEAETCVKELQSRDLDMQNLSIVGALEGAVVVGGPSALGAALYGLGIHEDSIVQYETAIKVHPVATHELADQPSKDNLVTSAAAKGRR